MTASDRAPHGLERSVGAAAGDGSDATSAPPMARRSATDSLARMARGGQRAGRPRRLGDAGGGRRRTPRGRGQPGHRRLRRLPQRADPPRQPARVHHPALRGRGAAPPRRAGAPPALVGRLRPLPQGAGRRAAPSGPSTSAARSPPCPTRGSATPAGPTTSRRRCRSRCASSASRWRRSRRREMYTSGAYREQVLLAVSRRDEIEAVLAQHRTKKVAAGRGRVGAGGRRPGRLRRQRGRRRAAAASGDAIARFPYRPYCRECGRDTVTTTAYDEATTTLSATPARPAATRAPPTCRPTPTASSSGRSTGRCGGPTSR